ncbi:homocysteine S-methyltransferase family protein [bacterium]|nr:homocysteine S-methyltransferase family protein [bacterium]
MIDFRKIIAERRLIFDGAMGTQLMKFNLTADDYNGYESAPEILNLTRPDVVQAVHEKYFKVGVDIVETNSFGAQLHTLIEKGLGDKIYELNFESARLAKEVAAGFNGFVSGSIGPGSKLATLGQIGYDTLENSYFEQAIGLIEGGVDLIQIETAQDLLQVKAALNGVERAQRKLGINIQKIVQVTIELNQKMLLGSPVKTVVATLADYDLLALGLNCGSGPDSMIGPVAEFRAYSPFPISVLPNAGLPELVDGTLGYNLTPQQFGNHIKKIIDESNPEFIGGCCGTDEEYISEIVKIDKNREYVQSTPHIVPNALTSLYSESEIETFPKPFIVGERANANGSKKFREFLLDDDFESMCELFQDQKDEGAHAADIQLGYAGRDEVADLEQFLTMGYKEFTLPVVIDSTDSVAIERALKLIPSKSLINSINLDDGGQKATEILKLAKKFGANVVALTIDEDGMAKTTEKKVEIALRVEELAAKVGLKRERLLIDPLTFTLASGDESLKDAGVNTLNALRELKKRGFSTILGVSNISYGLKPSTRRILNSIFLQEAVAHGLDAAILHGGKITQTENSDKKAVKLCRELVYNNGDGYDPLEELLMLNIKKNEVDIATDDSLTAPEKVRNHIIYSKIKGITESIDEALKTFSPIEIINDLLLDAMKEVGRRFNSGKIQLPFVLKSAQVMKKAVAHLEPLMEQSDETIKGSILLATVKGDVHDIGKNLVDIILSNNGYKVFNVGIDLASSEIAASVSLYNPGYIGLSALLVNSLKEIKQTLKHFNRTGVQIPVVVGGSSLTKEFVDTEFAPLYDGRVYYAKDGFEAIAIMEGGEYLPFQKKAVVQKPKKELTPLVDEYERIARPENSEKVYAVTVEELLANISEKRLRISRMKVDKERFEAILKEFSSFSAISGEFLIRFSTVDETGFTFSKEEGKHPLDNYVKDDFFTLFAVTLRGNYLERLAQLKKDDKFEEYFLYHAFLAELAETLTELMQKEVIKQLGITTKDVKRFSVGYPAWSELSEQSKIDGVLTLSRIGVSLTEHFEMVPEMSVTGIVVHHPQIRKYRY